MRALCQTASNDPNPDIPSPNRCVADVLDFLTRRFGLGA
jgi:hypothetical protein